MVKKFGKICVVVLEQNEQDINKENPSPQAILFCAYQYLNI